MNPSHVRLGVTILACLLVFVFLGRAGAEIPQLISYQGKVTDSGGTPVADGTYDMAFKLFDAETGGTQEWESGTVPITVTDGIFSVLLGESPQIPILLHFTEDLWLEVIFDGVTQSPRHRMSSVGYAYMASGLVPGTKIEEAMFGEVLWVKNQNLTGASHGIMGKTQSTAGYGVIGNAEATSGGTRGVYGQSASSGGYGVVGYASATTGSTRGVSGEINSTAGSGVYGIAWATSGVCYGGYFESRSTEGTGVRGVVPATTGVTYGVYGRSYSTTDGARGVYGRSYATDGVTYGIFGTTASREGIGVYGSATSNSTSGTQYGGRFRCYGTPGYGVLGEATTGSGFSRGVQGQSSSTDGVGVYGSASANTGDTNGVYGRAVSPDGNGVTGMAESNSGANYGVYGRTNSTDGYGVYGLNAATSGEGIGIYGTTWSTDGTGVWGEGGSGQSGTGVIGRGALQGGIFHDLTSGNWAGCARLSYKVHGTGSVSFVQNHPHEADRVIVYAAPEGDEVATYTRGTARLENGEARVLLSETFKWVTNPGVGLTAHLTARGEAAPLAVASLTTEELVVRGPKDGPDDVAFDYLIYGLRIGFEEQSIVQEKDLEARIPSMEGHRELYSKHPELRKYTALERFKVMRAATGETEALDLGDSQALRNAIQEYDLAIHGPIVPNRGSHTKAEVEPHPPHPEGAESATPDVRDSAREQLEDVTEVRETQ